MYVWLLAINKLEVGDQVDSIAVSVFADISIELTNITITVSDGKIQITILIL